MKYFLGFIALIMTVAVATVSIGTALDAVLPQPVEAVDPITVPKEFSADTYEIRAENVRLMRQHCEIMAQHGAETKINCSKY